MTLKIIVFTQIHHK